MVPLMKPESGCSVCHSLALMSFQVLLDLSVSWIKLIILMKDD